MFRFLTGTIRFRIKSKVAETVINRLRHTIPINRIRIVNKDALEFTTQYIYRNSVYGIAKDLNAEIEIIDSSGLPVFIDKYKRRAGIWIGLFIAFAAIWISSGMIWEVRISGNIDVPDSDVRSVLKSLGISEGAFINKDKLEYIYNSFLIKEPRISWISVNYDGTVAKVSVKETEIVQKKVDANKNINIVAECDGMIRRLDVFDGNSEVSAGETVTKGQLLISSFVETRKTGVYMKAARGNVWASTVHNFEIIISREKCQKKDLSNKRSHSVLILGNRFPLWFEGENNYNKKEIHYQNERYLLFGKFPMPFIVESRCVSEFISEYSVLNEDEAKVLADKELECRINAELPNTQIIGNSCSVTETENSYVFKYELICYENISAYKEFEFE